MVEIIVDNFIYILKVIKNCYNILFLVFVNVKYLVIFNVTLNDLQKKKYKVTEKDFKTKM